LLATPLIEASGNLVIAGIVLSVVLKRPILPGQGIALYGMLYGTQRFVLEFFRGDAVRGVYGGLSTSQFISMGVIAISAALFLLPVLRKKKGEHDA
jgi:phosphatidylglycerol:prolipoprotein diacylglycerol transferase